MNILLFLKKKKKFPQHARHHLRPRLRPRGPRGLQQPDHLQLRGAHPAVQGDRQQARGGRRTVEMTFCGPFRPSLTVL